MQRVNNKEMTFLVEDIEAVLEMNRLLEEENRELKHEVTRLKSQISSLKAHDIERKSILWKKLQYPMNNSIASNKEVIQQKQQVSQTPEKPSPPPLPPPSSKGVDSATAGTPPPPPPMPSKSLLGSKLAVRRVPEVIEFYRYLNKKNAQIENRTTVKGGSTEGKNPNNMIGEIENKSLYLSAVKSAVEMQRELINDLIREIETAVFKDISEVEAFVKRLDGELSCLVDERAVLKHFPQWPERKADALREAACCFRDLKNVDTEIVSYNDNPKQPFPQTLQRLQTLQDRLERVIENIEKTREGTCKRYKELQIPSDWMLDTGLVGQIKLNSLRLAREYMKRIIKEFQSSRLSNSEDILHQGARFAYRVHQFAGGFDLDTEQVFEGLKQIYNTNFSQDKASDMQWPMIKK